MSITVLNYLDQQLVDNITQQASMRASKAAAATESSDFAASLTESSKMLAANNDNTGSQTSTTTVSSPEDYEAYFEEASNAYGVSTTILKSIAKAESNFNPSAVSSAGAIGIMQLMPATAAALGVSNSYDARENILGGAKYISQLLSKYQGNISLALAAYNAGSGNVDKYGGIPPFTETQNYVQKVLSYMNGTFSTDSSSNTASSSGIFGLTGEERNTANELLGKFFAANNISKSTLDMFVALLKTLSTVSGNTSTSTSTTTNSSATNTATSGNSVYPSASIAAPVLPADTPAAVTGTAIPAPVVPTVDPVTPVVDPVVTTDDIPADEVSTEDDAANPTDENSVADTAILPSDNSGENTASDTTTTPDSNTGDAIAAPSI